MKLSPLLFALAISTTADAGRSKGPLDRVDSVKPFDTDIYNIFFDGDEKAIITVRGDGSTDLDCALYDEGGHKIADDSDSTDHCVLTFHPKWTGQFTLKIHNLGKHLNIYRLRTN